VAESFKEGYGSKRAVLPMMMRGRRRKRRRKRWI
jgi:hypothetical protein